MVAGVSMPFEEIRQRLRIGYGQCQTGNKRKILPKAYQTKLDQIAIHLPMLL